MKHAKGPIWLSLNCLPAERYAVTPDRRACMSTAGGAAGATGGMEAAKAAAKEAKVPKGGWTLWVAVEMIEFCGMLL